MQTQSFIATERHQTPAVSEHPSADSDHVGIEVSLKLYSYPKCDREPVKILVIGSREAVNTVIKTLHQLRFAEILEWTDFLPAPSGAQPLQFQKGEVMKALVKYLPR